MKYRWRRRSPNEGAGGAGRSGPAANQAARRCRRRGSGRVPVSQRAGRKLPAPDCGDGAAINCDPPTPHPPPHTHTARPRPPARRVVTPAGRRRESCGRGDAAPAPAGRGGSGGEPQRAGVESGGQRRRRAGVAPDAAPPPPANCAGGVRFPPLLARSPANLASSKPYLHCFHSTGPRLPLQALGQLRRAGYKQPDSA